VVRGLGAQNVNCNAGNAHNSCRRTRTSVPDDHAFHQIPEHGDDQEKHYIYGIVYSGHLNVVPTPPLTGLIQKSANTAHRSAPSEKAFFIK